MKSERNVLVLVMGLAVAIAAAAQSNGALRWRAGTSALGLQPAVAAPAAQCGPFSLACDTSASVALYANRETARTLSMQVGTFEAGTALKTPRSPGLSLAVVGKAGLFWDLGVYGRVGAVTGRGNAFAGAPGAEGGLTYGVGLSWDFSRSASAVLGFDSYDMRGQGDVRATSLGLQWRY